MIKLSKDNLFFWRYFFGWGIVLTHIIFIIFVFNMNFWPVYIVYFSFAIMHFVVAKVWRYLLIADVYISNDFNLIKIKDFNSTTEISRNQIVKFKTSFGITYIIFEDNGLRLRFYFMVNSTENLKYLTVNHI
jgi:hypothetical protein